MANYFFFLSILVVSTLAAGGCCNYDCRCVQEHGSRNFCQEWSCDVRVDPCFPGTSILNGAEKPMSSLVVGDVALSPEGDDLVYNWIHREPSVVSEFLKIETDDGVLEVSPEHLIFLNGQYQFAKNAQVGDILNKLGDETARVTAISSFLSKGVYAPITQSGEMYVDGFRPLMYFREANDGVHWWPQFIKSVYDFIYK